MLLTWYICSDSFCNKPLLMWYTVLFMMGYSIGHGDNRHLAWSSSSPLMFLLLLSFFSLTSHEKEKNLYSDDSFDLRIPDILPNFSAFPTLSEFWYWYAQNQNLVLLGFQLPIESLWYTSTETWKNKHVKYICFCLSKMAQFTWILRACLDTRIRA
jgi:hypothetical protein